MSAGASVFERERFAELLNQPVFSKTDRRFGEFILSGEESPEPLLGLAAVLVSYQLGRGHVFLDLENPPVFGEDLVLPEWPEPEEWRAVLEKSEAVGVPGEVCPLILTDSGKLYLHRYWSYENLLAGRLRELSESVPERGEVDEARLDQLFAGAPEQRVAAKMALTRSFAVISGGPGTGKTTTVLKILLMLLEREPETVIRLTAPTGKAAARLKESIDSGLAQLGEIDPALRAILEELDASTIHRLLGAVSGSVYFRHDEGNPLVADVVVLDEASMVDLPLMAKLFAALPPGARMIMLGDRDQLASVEAGSVFTGIVDAATGEEPPLRNAAALLEKNFRFGNESGIFEVCREVRKGDGEAALAVLKENRDDLGWRELPEAGELKEQLRPLVVAGFRELLLAENPDEALEAFGRFQILTAVRRGPYGREGINQLVEEILCDENWMPAGKRYYRGRPVMVTENDYMLRLFNGDIGILHEDEEGKLMAFFRREDGELRKVSPLRLPFVETAYAMTVHKSQGSEFQEVLTILPAREMPILTRELVYTAISRARKRAELWAAEPVFLAAVGRRSDRGSGLVEMLEKNKREIK